MALEKKHRIKLFERNQADVTLTEAGRVFVEEARLSLLHNERAMRVVALGRKNYLFAGSDNSGDRAAAIYSLLGSAKLNGLDPEIRLQHVLERIADHPSSKINDLLPWNVTIESANEQS